MTTTLSSSAVAEIAGISYRQLDYWVRQGGLLTNYVEEHAPGKGRYRRWKPEVTPVLRTVGVIRRAMISDYSAVPICYLARIIKALERNDDLVVLDDDRIVTIDLRAARRVAS